MIFNKIMNKTKYSIYNSLKLRRNNWKVSFAFYLQKFRHNSDSNPIFNVFLESRKKFSPTQKNL